MSVMILTSTLVAFPNSIEESYFMVLNHSLVGIPEQSICLAIVKARILLRARAFGHHVSNLVIRVRDNELRCVDSSGRREVLVRHDFLSLLSRNSKGVIRRDMIPATLSYMLLFGMLNSR